MRCCEELRVKLFDDSFLLSSVLDAQTDGWSCKRECLLSLQELHELAAMNRASDPIRQASLI